jgi:hypothetical protein
MVALTLDTFSPADEASDIAVNANLVTATEPTGSTGWTKGENVEIKWQTSGSASSKAYASPTTELNPLSYPGRNLSPSFQRRASRHNPVFLGLLRTIRGLEGSNRSKNEGTISKKTAKHKSQKERRGNK